MVKSVAALATVLNPRIEATPTVVRYLDSIFIGNIPHFIFRYFTFFYYFFITLFLLGLIHYFNFKNYLN